MTVVPPTPTRNDPNRRPIRGATVRAMQTGQQVMAMLLTIIGAVRAVGEGVSVPVAIICALAVLAWSAAGLAIPRHAGASSWSVWWLLGFTGLWICALAVSPEFMWLAFLLWLLAGHLLPMVWGLIYSAVVLSIVVTAPLLHNGSTSYANVLGPFIGGVFAFAISRGYLQLLEDADERERLVVSLTAAQHEMAELQDELALTQRHSGAIAERTRLSRDIHDTVAQGLSSIRLLAHAGIATTQDEAASRTLGQVERLAQDSLADVRRIVAALAPSELEDNALAQALQQMLTRAHDETGIAIESRVDDSLPLIPNEAEVALLRTAQSALANVRLHSGASKVVLSLIDAGDSVRLDIIDDGSGFDLESWESTPGTSSTGYGLRFMQARLRELGGGLDIETAPGEGTAISAHLPVTVGTSDRDSKEMT